jgi:hypothetical protein
MTKREYEMIARAFRETLQVIIEQSDPDTSDTKYLAVMSAARKLATKLAVDNPRFNRERFISSRRPLHNQLGEIQMALMKAGKAALARMVSEKVDITHGNTSGRTLQRLAVLSYGRLPQNDRATFARDVSESETYVIFSYETPIAWYRFDTAQWMVPQVTYSPTTNQHQHAVRMATS